MATVDCTAANVRTQPRRSSRLIGVVYRGDRVRILKGMMNKPAREGGYYTHFKIKYRAEGGHTKRGWIISECVLDSLYGQ